MLFWLNEKIEKNNTIILSKKAMLVASCQRELCESVSAQLNQNISPVKIFDKGKLALIPLTKIQGIRSRSDTPILDVVIGINTAGKEKTLSLSFSDPAARNKCAAYLKKLRLNAIQNTGGNQKAPVGADKTDAVMQAKKPRNTAATSSASLLEKPAKSDIPDPSSASSASSSEDLFEYEEVSLKHKLPNKKFLISGAVMASLLLLVLMYSFMGDSAASLYKAIQSKNITPQEISSLLNNGADINYQGVDGVTPILSAINHGKEDVVVSLVDKGADLKNEYNGETALDMAIASGLDKAAYSMLNKKAPSSNHKDLLIRAIQNKLSVNSLEKIISLGGDVNYVNENGSSVLATALLFTAKADVIKLLLSKGASTNIKVNGLPPALFARTRGRKDISRLIARYQ